MSLPKFGRLLWRGVQNVLKPSVRAAGIVQGHTKDVTPISKQLVAYAHNVINTNFAANARKNALHHFIHRSRKFALYSFVGFCMIDSPKNETNQPDLNFLLQAFQGGFLQKTRSCEVSDEYSSKIEEYDIVKRLGKPSSFGAVYHAKQNNKEVAVKMMFNINPRTNASCGAAIMQGFKREYNLLRSTDGESRNVLPKHPNIINILNVFVDNTKLMPDALSMYPSMLPSHHFKEGFGRNKTLFLVMPKYSKSLQCYLEENKLLPFENKLYLFCQLLEAVAHMEKNKVAHRDLKSDNLLIDTDHTHPQLVVADFGSCFDGRETNMKLPYQTEYVEKGGNPALMAPEILDTQPGIDTCLDYTKADVWAAGSIAYQIFGQQNPLYITDDPDTIPPLQSGNLVLDLVVKSIMQKNPEHRLSAEDSSNILCCLFYKCPLLWFFPDHHGCKEEIKLWLLEMSYECHRKHENKDFQLFETFLARTNVDEITSSIKRLFQCRKD